MLDLTIVLVDRGKVTIDEYHLNSDDTSYKDGKYYSGLAPGLSVLAVPLYLAVKSAFFFVPEELEERLDSFLRTSPGEKFAGDYSLRWTPKPSRQLALTILANVALGIIPNVLFAVMLFSFFEDISTRRNFNLFLVLTLSFASTWFYHGTGLYTQTLATIFLFSSFFILWKKSRGGRIRGGSFWAGLLLGLGGATDIPALAYGIPVIIYGLRKIKPREWMGGAIGYALPVLGLALYNSVAFGSPLLTPYHFRSASPVHDKPYVGLVLPSLALLKHRLFGRAEGLLAIMPWVALAVLSLAALFHVRKHRSEIAPDLSNEREEKKVITLF